MARLSERRTGNSSVVGSNLSHNRFLFIFRRFTLEKKKKMEAYELMCFNK